MFHSATCPLGKLLRRCRRHAIQPHCDAGDAVARGLARDADREAPSARGGHLLSRVVPRHARADGKDRGAGFRQLVDAGGGEFDGIALGRGVGGDAEDIAHDQPIARGDAACGRGDPDDVAILDIGLHGSEPFRGLDADHGDSPCDARDLPIEVCKRGGHFAVARVGDALAVVFDGADALIARGHQSVPPSG